MLGCTLIVFAKAPYPGRVKTRLCPPCTPHEAATIARAALADTLTTVQSTPATRRVLALEGSPGPWLPPGFDVVAQPCAPFDERLGAAFEAADGPAFLVGMDTPHLRVADLLQAQRILCTAGTDAVLGLAADGGWWGLGLRHPDWRAVHGVPPSTPSTGFRQAERLRDLNLHTRLLPLLRDVDDFGDARAVAALVPDTTFGRSVTAVTHAINARGAAAVGEHHTTQPIEAR